MSWGGKRLGAGRPAGSSNSKSNEYRALLEPHREELVAKAVEMAMGGDSTALRLCLDRLIPPLKGQDAPVAIEVQGETLAEMADAVIQLGESGQLSVSELTSLMQMVSTMARIVDVDDLERRITELEKRRK